MTTLQGYRKRKFKYIKDFAAASGYGTSKASGILRGLYHMALSKDEVKHLASVLGISFVECADACDNTFAELKHYKGDDWKRTPRTHKGIWERWRWEEDLVRMGRKAAETGDWREFREKTRFNWQEEAFARDKSRAWSSSDGETWTHTRGSTTSTIHHDCFSILGIPSTATASQIKAAFVAKVKAASDGKGGYNGDMDKLVQAKERALELLKIRTGA